ncbi:MAG: hypothetical protein LIP02_00755, partial [Bacteroidales bacterium]|nr:hypothetical protein [Bacteroidales bacterium]
MQDAVIEYKAGGEIDSTNAADREQTLPFDPRDPLSDLRPLTSTRDPTHPPQFAPAPANPTPTRPAAPPPPPRPA